MESRRRCKLGIWDETIPGIVFDNEGICNYARIQLSLMHDYPLGTVGADKWDAIIKAIQSKGKGRKYDCVIGVSGGTDSSYLLHLARLWNLRPLAVNLDNGWSSDIALKNIKAMTKQLGIDLETYVVDYEEMKDLLRAYMFAGLPWIDNPTDQAIQAILYRYAQKEGISTILIGTDFRSEGKQPAEWTYSDNRQLRYIHRKFGKTRLKTYPHNSFFKLMFSGYLRGIKMFSPYNYLAYNKAEAQQFLIEKYGWQYYGEHHHENLFTKWVIGYWMYEKFGIDKRIITYSAQVLNGAISREDALKIVAEKPYSISKIEEETNFVLKKLDVQKDVFEQIWKSPEKSFLDYPSWYGFIQRFSGLILPIARLIIPVKPKMFYELEQRRK
jgi:N-acetyl sugar amidotransferase